jgi:hypothetical protein
MQYRGAVLKGKLKESKGSGQRDSIDAKGQAKGQKVPD